MKNFKEEETETTQSYPISWTRILARGIDTLICFFIIYICCFPLFLIQIDKLIFPIYGSSGTGGFWLFKSCWVILRAFCFLFYEIFFLTILSTTPGKSLLGLSIVAQDGGGLPFTSAVSRSIILCGCLFLFFMPYISMIIPILCFVHLYDYKTRTGKFMWDRSNRWMVSSKKKIPMIGRLIGIILLILSIIAILLIVISAPNTKAIIKNFYTIFKIFVF